MRPGILGYCAQRLADGLSVTTKIIEICPLAVMRNCPETASPITECHYPWSHGRASSLPICMDIGRMMASMLDIQIW